MMKQKDNTQQCPAFQELCQKNVPLNGKSEKYCRIRCDGAASAVSQGKRTRASAV